MEIWCGGGAPNSIENKMKSLLSIRWFGNSRRVCFGTGFRAFQRSRRLNKASFCTSVSRWKSDSLETYRLYLVTDDKYCLDHEEFIGKVKAAVKGGVSCVQLRLKKASTKEYVDLARKLKLALNNSVPLIIDDRLDVALAVDADGLHVGEDDLDAMLARQFWPKHKILGVSGYGDLDKTKHIVQRLGRNMSYIAGGGVDFSPTKKINPKGAASYYDLKQCLNEIDKRDGGLPLVAIGGVNEKNASDTIFAGADGLCVVSELLDLPANKIEAKARKLSQLINSSIKEKTILKNLRSNVESLGNAVQRIRDKRPLVHCITNYVSMDLSANVLLAASCSPAMVHCEEEAAKFADMCGTVGGAVSINVGTLSKPWATSIQQTAQECHRSSIPWVLDPVGVGVPALKFRTDLCVQLCTKYKPTVIRGNVAECIALATAIVGPRSSSPITNQSGADSLTDTAAIDFHEIDALAKTTGAIVCVTGSLDYISCGLTGQKYLVKHDVPLLQSITATGCSLSSLIGGFLATAKCSSQYALATAHATAFFSLAAERALKKLEEAGSVTTIGPGSFRVALLDTLHSISPQELDAFAKIHQVGFSNSDP